MNTKFIQSIIIFIAIFIIGGVSSSYAVSSDNNKLSDINDHTYKSSIEYLLNKNIVQGYSDGTFRPNSQINRAEFTKMIIGSKYGIDAYKNEYNCFKDVKTEWFAPYICYAKKKGIVNGYPDGTFRPERTINFAEAAKIIVNVFGTLVKSDAVWYRPYVAQLSDIKSIPPTVSSLDHKVTRSEIAELVWRVKEKISSKSHATYNGSGVVLSSVVKQDEPKKSESSSSNPKTSSPPVTFFIPSGGGGGGGGGSSSSGSTTVSGAGSNSSSSSSGSSSTSSGGGTISSSSSSSGTGSDSSSSSSGSSSTSSGGGDSSSSSTSSGGSSSSSTSSGGTSSGSSTSSGGGTTSSSSSTSSGGTTSSSSSSGGTSSSGSTSSGGSTSSSSSTSSGGSSSSSTSSGGDSSSSSSGGTSSSSSTSSGGSTSSSSSTSSGGDTTSSSSSTSSSGGGSTSGTTHYIRTDGGTYTQCDGKTNVAYSASITDKKCAVNHPFQLFPPGGSARITGGDTVIIANGSYKMGSGAPGATSDDKCNQAWSYECVMSKIPSGPSKDKPTKILGAGYNSGCATKPELWGSGRPWAIIDMNGSSNVEMQCLEITDRSQCVEFHSGGNSCNRDSAPYGDWASVGLRASDSSNVLLKNLDIHGLAHTGVHAGRLTDWTIESTKIEGNGWVGWDGDIDGSDANTGTMTFKKVNVDWNGCGQTYPGRLPIGCWGQSAGGYGDGLGTGATGGDWIFEDSTFLHNTSDGLDMLYHRNGGKITVTRVHAEGNAGNQLKTNGNAQITDSIIVGNCAYFQGKSFTHNVDACRALGNALSIGGEGSTTPILVYNNSVYSEGDGLLLAEGTATVKIRNNIFYAGTDYHQNFEKSFYLYSEGAITFDQDYNMVYQAKDSGGYCAAGTHNICSSDPQFQSVNSSSFDLQLKSTSPAIDVGITAITSTDYIKSTRPKGSGVDMGAYEY